MHDVLIVGGGLCGLVAFRQLKHLDVLLLEARPRLGGRIWTVQDEGAGHYDLGPAWFWPPHQEVFQLAEELKIPYFEQYEDGAALYERSGKVRKIANPQADSVSYRLHGGTGALIRALQEQLPTEKILLGREVLKIEEKDGGVEVSAAVAGEDQSTRLYAKRVLVTLPPRLAARVHYSPQLPSSVLEVMHRTPTWMGNAMKVVVGYDLPPSSVPFWRQKQLAGYAISERGPCQQIHDHCSGEGVSMRRHALFGWVDEDDPVKSLSKEERRLRVLEQLAQLFGEADDPNRPTPRRRCLFIRSRTGRRTLTRIIRLNPRSGSGTTRATATRRSRRPR
ncbi:unnamed protein product [Durusdinium trenchii]|uniref:monoamine oxidase n=2 Tax=Durusdinium trenchii TaxID=1381693 RepID=A0ABP0NRI6_9DINO